MLVSGTGTKMGATRTQSSEKSFLPRGHLFPFLLVTGLFFLWGVPNNLNDVLIRQFMTSFAISRFQAGLVQFAFYLGYFLLATPAAMLMRRAGYKAGFLVGLVLFGAGAVLFWPAALIGRYSFFLFALFVVASGLSFLETAANPFIAQFGAPESSERRLNFSQAFNPLGSIAGVLLGTAFIFSGVELTAPQIAHLQTIGQYHAYLHGETMRVVRPYVILGLIAWAWALMIARTRFPVLAGEDESSKRDSPALPSRQLLGYPSLIFAVIAQFLYVGAQVGTWSYFIQYVEEYAHQPEKIAGYLLTGTLAAFAIGRFFSAWLMRFVSPGRLMGIYSLCNVVLVGIGVLFPGWVGLWSLFLTSFFMSLMFPTIFALGIRDLGSNAKLGASLIVMAIVGGAILTPLMGWISQVTGSGAVAYLVPLAAYLFVAWFSFWQSAKAGEEAPATTGPVTIP
jgi:MFS transporter, FHS family, L-fucose permease